MYKWFFAGAAAVIIPLLLVYLIKNKRYKFFYFAYKTFNRDIRAAKYFLQMNVQLGKWNRKKKTLPKLFEEIVKEYPNKIAFYFEDEQWTFTQLDQFSNQIANHFKEKGYKKGDIVALMLENRPEYVGIWLGLSKLGILTALINTNLTEDSLTHCVNISEAKVLIHGGLYETVINNIKEKLKVQHIYQFNEEISKTSILNGSLNLMQEIQSASKTELPETLLGEPQDKLFYIYTSGTTGLPKAAVLTNLRFMYITCGMHIFGCFDVYDIIYTPLPLYHTAGGIMGIGQTLIYGNSMALRKKFSASNYWADCKKYNCTIAQYIGEMCRYILIAYKEETPIDHPVKIMFGNGLRPQIWKKFVETFKIEKVFEFYGATEGNSNLMNIDNKEGAVGFVPRLSMGLYPVSLIKSDEATGEPLRNTKELCIECKIGEPGLFIGRIDVNRTIRNFTGYADKNATQKKIITDVFKKGDAYFNTGDLLVQDEMGYFYFKDRTGDTFRWKGENVATTEIEAVITNYIQLKDSIVYGVVVPGTEGRAGMVTIVDPDGTLSRENLYASLKKNLPLYAIPVFLRIAKSMDLTGTFKIKKKDLQDEGFDVNRIHDKLYIIDAKNSTYSPLTNEIYENIINGKLRL
ncbi:unnamed protein product [Brassicogethes aeneus]|uniref:Very long-chain fatty acid transport protein n=1 Tax=Brassicogethes aeneus TaxID=1431903 RepID=A0A9P0AXU4_BRAAE|nr:unnamed protein product [Brassicogethes aeneus]